MTPSRLQGSLVPTSPRLRVKGAALLAALALVWATVASAQSLPELLPQDVVLAVGLHEFEDQSERLRPFLDEAERLGLADTVGDAVPGDAADDLDDAEDAVPDALRELDAMDFLGQEAWLTVAASQARPMPAVTVIARVSDDAAAGLDEVMAAAVEEDPGVSRLEEEGRTLYTRVPSGGDDLPLPVSYAQSENVLVASTDVEVVRFVLRAQSGAGEPNMAGSALYASLRDLGEGTALGMLDADPLLAAAEPFAASTEFAPLVDRLRTAVQTAGPSVGLIRFSDEGIASSSRQLTDAQGPDGALHTLLTQSNAPGRDVLAFAPAESIAVSVGTFDVGGWWAWLDDVLGSVADEGVPTATEAVQMFGLDVNVALLDWAGSQIAQVQASAPEVAEPGVTPDALLGSQVLLIESRDDAAAETGLSALLGAIGPGLGGMTSPGGEAAPTPETVEVAGQQVLRLQIAEGFLIDAAVVDGWVLLSGSSDATTAMLEAYAQGGGATVLEDAAGGVPSDARAWSVTDGQRAMRGSVSGLVGQLQMMAGMAGAAELDFEDVDQAGAAVTEFAEFVAERMGPSVTVTTVEGDVLHTEGSTKIGW